MNKLSVMRCPPVWVIGIYVVMCPFFVPTKKRQEKQIWVVPVNLRQLHLLLQFVSGDPNMSGHARQRDVYLKY